MIVGVKADMLLGRFLGECLAETQEPKKIQSSIQEQLSRSTILDRREGKIFKSNFKCLSEKRVRVFNDLCADLASDMASDNETDLLDIFSDPELKPEELAQKPKEQPQTIEKLSQKVRKSGLKRCKANRLLKEIKQRFRIVHRLDTQRRELRERQRKANNKHLQAKRAHEWDKLMFKIENEAMEAQIEHKKAAKKLKAAGKYQELTESALENHFNTSAGYKISRDEKMETFLYNMLADRDGTDIAPYKSWEKIDQECSSDSESSASELDLTYATGSVPSIRYRVSL